MSLVVGNEWDSDTKIEEIRGTNVLDKMWLDLAKSAYTSQFHQLAAFLGETKDYFDPYPPDFIFLTLNHIDYTIFSSTFASLPQLHWYIFTSQFHLPQQYYHIRPLKCRKKRWKTSTYHGAEPSSPNHPTTKSLIQAATSPIQQALTAPRTPFLPARYGPTILFEHALHFPPNPLTRKLAK